MFVKLNAVVQKSEKEVFVAVSKIFGVGRSEDLKVSYVLSDTGHAIMVKESVDEIKNLIEEAKKNIDKI